MTAADVLGLSTSCPTGRAAPWTQWGRQNIHRRRSWTRRAHRQGTTPWHSSCDGDRGCLAAGLVLAAAETSPRPPGPRTGAASQATELDLTITVHPRASDLDNEQYDPWESFNEKMFTFNYNVDKYA